MSILFKNCNYHKHPAYGQMLEISLCCYVRGLELQHKDIYIEWQDVRFLWDDNGNCLGGLKVPNSKTLPFTYISNDEQVDVDTIIDIGNPNSLYDDSKPIISKSGCRLKPCHIYIKEYLKTHNELPKFKLKNHNKTSKPYVLLHYRKSMKSIQQQRNIPSGIYMKLIRYIRKNYNVDIYKIGEPSPIDKHCDKAFSYFIEDTSELFKLIYNCSLYIGPPSGPWVVPIYMRKPLISIVKDKESYDREMNGIAPILNDEQHLLMLTKDNYNLMKEIIDKNIGDL